MADPNKTEKATPRREKKAREQGQVARSRDLISGLAFTAAVLSLGWSGGKVPSMWHTSEPTAAVRTSSAGSSPHNNWRIEELESW